MAQNIYEIQTVSSAFSGRIPEHLWRTVNRAKTTTGALRHYNRHWAWYHPQPNCWSGHVRILRNGKPVVIEYDHSVYEVE